jgi:hypothetical protein
MSESNLYNPLRGNPVRITKRITRATFNKNPAYAEDFEYNTSNDSDSNECYTIMTHKVKGRDAGLLIKEGEEKVPDISE